MWVIFKPEFYSRSGRCICQDIKKARWPFKILGVILCGIFPALCLALICAKPDFSLQIACGFGLLLSLCFAIYNLKGPIARAIAEIEAARRNADEEASGIELQPRELQPRELQPRELQPRELQPRELQPCELQPAADSRVSVTTWFTFPHRGVPPTTIDDDDILSRVREHNERYSHTGINYPITETSFSQTQEDSTESALVPHVTHRSRHPSRSPRGDSSIIKFFVTTTLCHPPPEEGD